MICNHLGGTHKKAPQLMASCRAYSNLP